MGYEGPAHGMALDAKAMRRELKALAGRKSDRGALRKEALAANASGCVADNGIMRRVDCSPGRRLFQLRRRPCPSTSIVAPVRRPGMLAPMSTTKGAFLTPRFFSPGTLCPENA